MIVGAGILLCASAPEAAGGAYRIKSGHPRLIIEDVAKMARRCGGALAEDYRVVKERADAAVRRRGIEFINNAWSIPEDLMNCGLGPSPRPSRAQRRCCMTGDKVVSPL